MNHFQIGKFRASNFFAEFMKIKDSCRGFTSGRGRIVFVLLYLNVSISIAFSQSIDTTLLINAQIDSFLRKEGIFEIEGIRGVSRAFSKFPFTDKLPNGVVIINYPDSNLKLVEATVNEGKLNGEMVVFYQSGVIKERMNFVNNTMEGTYLRHTPKGVLSLSIEIKAGMYHGAMTEYYNSGFYSERQYYKSGYPFGKRETWHVNGVKLCEQQEDYYGHTNGYCQCWYDNGNKSIDGYFYGEMPIGEVKYYYRNGNLKKQGHALSFMKDTLPPNMYNIRIWEIESETGSEIHSSGMYNEWYEDGSPKVVVTPDVSDSMKINVEYFYPNKQMKEKGSVVLFEAELNNNYLHVPTTFYGWKKKGPWFAWSEQGELVEKTVY